MFYLVRPWIHRILPLSCKYLKTQYLQYIEKATVTVDFDNTSLKALLALIRRAGQAIMEIYNSGDFQKEIKADDSPLTLADRTSHKILTSYLRETFPAIPVISEEDKEIPMAQRENWSCFWLVDPLDGTKEFIRREKDFTVNVALVENSRPTLGIVYAPACDWMYWGQAVQGKPAIAFKQIGSQPPQTLPLPQATHKDRVALRSRSHASPEEEQILQRLNVTRMISMGSSLKFCLVAEGQADVYYRHGPTWEWDSAAAHAVVLGSGGVVLTPNATTELPYNKPTLKNDFGFICLRDPAMAKEITNT